MNIDYELKQYEDLKKELQQLYEKKGEAAKFRSKCLWVEKGERPTNYFFNLEKRNYSRRVISELELEEGDIITNEKQILSEIESYFMNLYSSCGRRGGLMVSALDSGASAPGSSPGRGHCVVFLGKTLYSHGASLHPGV